MAMKKIYKGPTKCDNGVALNPAPAKKPAPPMKKRFNPQSYLIAFILLLISISAFSIRLFSVIIYESVIHEYDPWYNYRVAKYIVKNGFPAFFAWFDAKTWYPVGRDIFRTTYFGMMFTSALLYRLLDLLRLHVHIREVCVFTGPVMAAMLCLVVYEFARGVWDPTAGLVAAALMAVVPPGISRSMAGGYDYECIAIFAMALAFYCWARAVETGSRARAVASGLSYFYMVSVWGGYLFVLNLIAVHVCVLFALGLFWAGFYGPNVYRAYTIYYVIGTLLTQAVPMAGGQYFDRIYHLPALLVFLVLQAHEGFRYVRANVEKRRQPRVFAVSAALLFVAAAVLLSSDRAPKVGLTGRMYHLLGIKHGISIVNSVAEHSSLSFRRFLENFAYVCYALPLGVAGLLCRLRSPRSVLLLLYLLFGMLFSIHMMRFVMILAPAVCVIAGIGVSCGVNVIRGLTRKNNHKAFKPFMHLVLILYVSAACYFFHSLTALSISAARQSFSSPSIILTARDQAGKIKYIDDFREGYLWLKHNTAEESHVMSWWDYGYQITGFSNRTVYIDNNTRDEERIAWVGSLLGSTEARAYKQLIDNKVDYLLVIFGGKIGYDSDDIAKSYWILKIASGYHKHIPAPGKGFLGQKSFQNSVIYKLCYYRFNEVNSNGFDHARGGIMANHEIKLKYFEEAFTSTNWMVRIYRVKRPEEIDKK